VNPRWLLDHGVEHESHLEKRFIMVALSCPVVVDIVHQPLQLTLCHEDGTTEKYTPDFKVTFRDQSSTIVEVNDPPEPRTTNMEDPEPDLVAELFS
jgi:hypothetical protein